MPLYEYHCTACDVVSEISHRISAPPATDCPQCGEAKLVKQISAAGFRLKGDGWYETDFKSGNKRNLAGDGGDGKPQSKSDGSASAKADGSAGDKSQSKPAPPKPAVSKPSGASSAT
ncbi:MAG: FmdB family zinc ribbon protein [Panacagrimonas sp.]